MRKLNVAARKASNQRIWRRLLMCSQQVRHNGDTERRVWWGQIRGQTINRLFLEGKLSHAGLKLPVGLSLGVSHMTRLHWQLECPLWSNARRGSAWATVTALRLLALSLKRCLTASIYDNRLLRVYWNNSAVPRRAESWSLSRATNAPPPRLLTVYKKERRRRRRCIG